MKKFQYFYDASGKPVKMVFQPQDANESLYQWFKYDAMGRLDTVFTNRTNNFFTARREAVYDYDDNHGGKVKRMELGGTVQGVDYTYTIRDWLKMINHQNINATEDPGHDGLAGGVHANFTVDRFGMVLSYHESEHGTNVDNSAAQYNGNIRSVIWNSGQGLSGYGFTYDNANRLVNANYKEYSGNWSLTNKYSEKSLQYDANGNILSLTRHLNSSTGSALNYTYDANKPNRLNKVTGLINAVYEYDHNGNMTRDTTKGYFAYDYRNMPVKVTRNDTTIEYAYDAGGQRTRKTIKKNGAILEQCIYIRNGSNVLAEYRNGQLDHYNIYGNGLIGKLKPFLNKAVMNAGSTNWAVTAKDTAELRGESRLDAGGSLLAVGQAQGYGDKRYYYLSDHLGSIRVVLTETGNVDSWSDYYPFGKESRGSNTSNEPKEQFTGKERDIEIGLDYFGARYYNYDIGRWMCVEPLNSKYPSLSVYSYSANNPISMLDIDGFEIYSIEINLDKATAIVHDDERPDMEVPIAIGSNETPSHEEGSVWQIVKIIKDPTNTENPIPWKDDKKNPYGPYLLVLADEKGKLQEPGKGKQLHGTNGPESSEHETMGILSEDYQGIYKEKTKPENPENRKITEGCVRFTNSVMKYMVEKAGIKNNAKVTFTRSKKESDKNEKNKNKEKQKEENK